MSPRLILSDNTLFNRLKTMITENELEPVGISFIESQMLSIRFTIRKKYTLHSSWTLLKPLISFGK